jgi:FtsZ-binding cell division protein ZapB
VSLLAEAYAARWGRRCADTRAAIETIEQLEKEIVKLKRDKAEVTNQLTRHQERAIKRGMDKITKCPRKATWSDNCALRVVKASWRVVMGDDSGEAVAEYHEAVEKWERSLTHGTCGVILEGVVEMKPEQMKPEQNGGAI